MSATYHSILFCDHPKEGFVNVYIDGLILGQINKADNKFTPDPLIERRNVFGSLEAMRNHVLSIMDAVVGKKEQPITPGPPPDPITIVEASAEGDVMSRVRTDVVGKPFLNPDTWPRETSRKVNLNGEEVEVPVTDGECVLTYDDVILMAVNQFRRQRGSPPVDPSEPFPMPHLSVVYHHRVPFEQLPGERDGSLWLGSKPVKVTNGMVINAVNTSGA
jgi:hypothetical protein